MNIQKTVKYTTQSLVYFINKQEKQNVRVNKRFNEVFKTIAAILNIADPRARSVRPRLNIPRVSIDDSSQVIPRSP